MPSSLCWFNLIRFCFRKMTQNVAALLIEMNKRKEHPVTGWQSPITSCCLNEHHVCFSSFRQLVQQEMSPCWPHWPALHCRFGERGCGGGGSEESEGVEASPLARLSGRIPAHRHGRGSTGSPNVSQLGWRRGSLRCLGVRAAHVRRSQLLSPGCRCLFPWASRSCPFRFPWLPPPPTAAPLSHFVFWHQPLFPSTRSVLTLCLSPPFRFLWLGVIFCLLNMQGQGDTWW